MAQLPGQFDATTVNPDSIYEPLPDGEYPVIIVDSEMKPTSKNDGSEYLSLSLEIIDGQYKGRIVFDRLNLVNANAKTVEIAQRTLSQICHAVGVMRVADSAELHNRPMLAKLGTEPGGTKPSGGNYPDRNKVKAYKPYGSAAPVPQAMTTPAPTQPAPSGKGTPPPWAKRA